MMSPTMLTLLVGLGILSAVQSSRESTVVGSGKELIQRVLGETLAANFTVCTLEVADDVNDTFDLSMPLPGHVRICGNSGVAVARGLYHYLRLYCKSSVAWGRNSSGDNINVPTPLPGDTWYHFRQSSSVKWRYYMNVCTVSYSSVWWDWRRWEREIDWMALHGINLPLAFTGQEYVIADVYNTMGVTEEEMQVYFTGPAFLAWNRMANFRTWAGPLPPDMREQQYSLQLRILERMRQLGMKPVLPGFSGHVPRGIERVFPGIKLQRDMDWAGFGANLSGDYFVEPTDPHFQEIAGAYYTRLAELMGTDHVYNADNFNEMTPSSGDPEYLANVSSAVYQAMKTAAGNASATWVMQGWLFMSGFWSQSRVQAYLNAVPDRNMIVLDLYAEVSPFWAKFHSFYGKPFIWCLLHNFGGRRALYGNLSHIGQAPHHALHAAGSTMIGIGLTPEAIEQNPVVYELMTDTAWHDSAIDVDFWLQEYVERRYRHGGGVLSVHAAWSVLQQSVYGLNWLDRFLGVMHRTPQVTTKSSVRVAYPAMPVQASMTHTSYTRGPENASAYDCAAVTSAWRHLTAGAVQVYTKHGAISGPLSYDLVDTGRQVLVDLHADFVTLANGAYLRWLHDKANVTDELSIVGDTMLTILQDLDALLGTDQNFLLGSWLDDALAMANSSGTEKEIVLLNAKNQITMWGPYMGYLNDYAEKHWSGLVGTYYQERWRLWLNALRSAVASGEPADAKTLESTLEHFQEGWYRSQDLFPASPSGDTLPVSEQLAKKWASAPSTAGFITIKDATIMGHDLHAPTRLVSRDVEQLKLMCAVNPACAGFTSDGFLKSDTGFVTVTPGSDLYIIDRK